jgi:hypothetical protein
VKVVLLTLLKLALSYVASVLLSLDYLSELSLLHLSYLSSVYLS